MMVRLHMRSSAYQLLLSIKPRNAIRLAVFSTLALALAHEAFSNSQEALMPSLLRHISSTDLML
jgi:hypothetical protein